MEKKNEWGEGLPDGNENQNVLGEEDNELQLEGEEIILEEPQMENEENMDDLEFNPEMDIDDTSNKIDKQDARSPAPELSENIAAETEISDGKYFLFLLFRSYNLFKFAR